MKKIVVIGIILGGILSMPMIHGVEPNCPNFTLATTVETAMEALERLKAGNERFYQDRSQLINVSAERRGQLVSGQKPYAVVVACSDSRVAPELIFNTGLGEIFDVRAAGNILDDTTLGSVEYGVLELEAPIVVVIGHENCGAVKAAYEAVVYNQKIKGNIGAIIKRIIPSVKETDEKSVEAATKQNVSNVVDQIKNDPALAELVAAGKVKVVEAYYTLDGKVNFLK